MPRPMSAVLCALAVATALMSAVPAFAGRPLAVGEAIPLVPPPGYTLRAVYTRPVLHSRWEPADTSFGRAFREPLYSTPPGYIYNHVRGYTRVRVFDPALRPVRKVAARTTVVKVKKKARPACITDLGYGHYYECR
jgi:hypothetical protein